MRYKVLNGLSLAMLSTSLGLASIPTLAAHAEEPLLELHSVGLYGWPEDAKDQRMMDTIKLLRARLGDLVEEMELDPIRGEMMRTGWDLLTGGSSLYLAPSEQGLNASFVMTPGNGNNESMHQQLADLALMGGIEFVHKDERASEAMGPMGPMMLAYDENRIWMALGESEPASMQVQRYGLPAGTTPLMSGRLDVNGLLEFFAPDMIEEFEAQSEMMPGNPLGMFIGEDAVVIEFSAGVDESKMHVVSRLIGAKASMLRSSISPTLFTKESFRMVPRDAVRVTAVQTNMSNTLRTIEQAIEMSGENPLAEINRGLGMDLIDDVLANIGDRVLFYQSMSTGGGGLTSAVVIVELRDAPKMASSHAKLVGKLNQLAEDEMDGYARVQSREIDGTDIFTMTVPGLPIPFEPSWAISNGQLVIAMSPVSIEAAISQMAPSSTTSVLQNAKFAEAILTRIPDEGAAAVSYMDTPRMVEKGYGLTNMLSSAIANMARSPKEPARVQGSLMLPFAEFAEGVQSSGSVSKWEGDDLVTHYFGDRSVMVQLASGLGSVADMQGIVIPAIVAGTTLPALGKARQQAEKLKSATQLRGIVQGMIIYGSNSDGQPPESIDELLKLGYIDAELLHSPMGAARDGGPDYTVRMTEQAVGSFDASYIVAVDRAAIVNDNWEVYVGFADAHVEMLTLADLNVLLDLPQNKGAREELELPQF